MHGGILVSSLWASGVFSSSGQGLGHLLTVEAMVQEGLGGRWLPKVKTPGEDTCFCYSKKGLQWGE